MSVLPILAFLAAAAVGAPASGVQVLGTIDFAGADVVQARGINNAGDIVGYRTAGGVTESFLRTSAGDTLFQVDGDPTLALGVNDAGDTVGGVNTSLPGQDAFLRSVGGTAVRFQPLGDPDANANGINNAGVVVGAGNAFGTGGYLRATDGTVTAVDYVGLAGDVILKTNATDVNNAGLIIGHAIGQNGPDFFGRGWYSADDGASFTTITRPGEQFTYVWAGNDEGLLVGDFSTGFTGTRTGFVYEIASGAFFPFTVPGADWTVPTGINDAGQIVGFSRDAATSRITGFVAVIPEPSAALMAAAGAFATIGARRRRFA